MNSYQKAVLTIMVFVSSFHCVHESASKTVMPESRKMLGGPSLSLTVPLARHLIQMASEHKLQATSWGLCASPNPKNGFLFAHRAYCIDGQRPAEKWQRTANMSVARYVRYLRTHWAPIPVGVGLALIALQHYWRVRRRESAKLGDSTQPLAHDWEITCYKMVPLRAMSRIWGRVNEVELPVWARHRVLGWYVSAFGCNLEEAQVEDLGEYRNLGEFFRRKLKDGTRPIDDGDCIVSPADGTMLHFGRVEGDKVEQVKGVTYSLNAFLGPRDWNEPNEGIVTKPGNVLYHCVIYLAPGDYHCFHSPVSWTVQFRRHFPGELFSVRPTMARWIAGLFNLNERAVYVGSWTHGFFSMAAVGATNVGSINVYFDKDLRTNSGRKARQFSNCCLPKVSCQKGEPFGEFNLGSTIVMVFEAPKDFKFKVAPGERVRVGQALNVCPDDKKGCATQ